MGKRANRVSRSGGRTFAFAKGGSAIILGTEQQRVMRYPLADFSAPPYVPNTDYKVPIRGMSVSRRGHRIALVTSSGNLHVLETWDLYEVNVGNVTAAKVKDAAFGADERTLVTLGEDSLVRVWDLASFEAMPEMGAPGWIINSISWASDQSTVIYATENGGFASNDASHHERYLPSKWNVRRMYHSANLDGSELWVAGDAKDLRRFHREKNDWKQMQSISFPQPLRNVAWHEGSNRIAVFAYDGLRVLTGDGRILAHHPDQLPASQASIVWRPDGRRFVTNHLDDSVARVWDADGKQLAELRPAIPSPLRCLAYTSDGRRVALGYHNGWVVLIDDATLTETGVSFAAHQSANRIARF
jgi:WD40 repeat protein